MISAETLKQFCGADSITEHVDEAHYTTAFTIRKGHQTLCIGASIVDGVHPALKKHH